MKQHEKIEDQKVRYLEKMYELRKQKEATINGLIDLNAELEEQKKDLIVGAYQNGARDFIEANYTDELYEYNLQLDTWRILDISIIVFAIDISTQYDITF